MRAPFAWTVPCLVLVTIGPRAAMAQSCGAGFANVIENCHFNTSPTTGWTYTAGAGGSETVDCVTACNANRATGAIGIGFGQCFAAAALPPGTYEYGVRVRPIVQVFDCSVLVETMANAGCPIADVPLSSDSETLSTFSGTGYDLISGSVALSGAGYASVRFRVNCAVVGGAGTPTALFDDAFLQLPPPGIFTITVDSASVPEGDPPAIRMVTFTVTRGGGTGNAETVEVAVSGSAAQPSDYFGAVMPFEVLSFAPGDTQKTIVVTAVSDGTPEADETITMTLQNPSGLATVGSPASATHTIEDDDTVSAVEIPTLGRWGMIVIACAVVLAALWLLRRVSPLPSSPRSR
jgi:hypothetical protein